jgi:hypothetical protein
VRRPSLDPVGDLVAALDPAARAIPLPAGQTPADVEGKRSRLAALLLASAPPSVSAALRRIDEDQAWLSGGPKQGSPARLAELAQRRRTLVEAQHRRAAWLEAHRGDLERWAALDATAVWRAQARARATELTRTRTVADELRLLREHRFADRGRGHGRERGLALDEDLAGIAR